MREHPKKVGQDTPKSHDEKLRTQSSNLGGRPVSGFKFWGYLQGKHRKLSSGYTVDSCRPLFSHLSQVSLSRPAIYWIRSKEEPKNEYKNDDFEGQWYLKNAGVLSEKKYFKAPGTQSRARQLLLYKQIQDYVSIEPKETDGNYPYASANSGFCTRIYLSCPQCINHIVQRSQFFFQLWFLQLQIRSPILSYLQQNPLTHLS